MPQPCMLHGDFGPRWHVAAAVPPLVGPEPRQLRSPAHPHRLYILQATPSTSSLAARATVIPGLGCTIGSRRSRMGVALVLSYRL
jgi:hypothetical protein